MVLIKSYIAPPLREREVLRYTGSRRETDSVRETLDDCLKEIAGKLTYKVCWMPLTVRIDGDVCDFDVCSVSSKDLARNLSGCDTAVLFAATVGVGIDRLIAKYSAVSPVKALLLDAIGTERIESLCNLFCKDIVCEYKKSAKPRFSPGYGDLDLSFQHNVFSLLNCQKKIGLTMTDSFMMSPSKSVTAIIGLCDGGEQTARRCENCDDESCAFRSVL